MNKLSQSKEVQILKLLLKGNSLRGTAELVGCSFNSVIKLLIAVGAACQKFHDEMVVNLNSRRVQCDEMHCFVYAKRKNAKETGNPEAGDAWTWIAIDADTRLIVSWYVGKRNIQSAHIFMRDLKSRLIHPVQLSTDGLTMYVDAVKKSFGDDVSFAQVDKIYETRLTKGGYTSKKTYYAGAEIKPISGNPDKKHISTNYVERYNLTMRMGMKRCARKTDAFSKKLVNHRLAIALQQVYYNFGRIHTTLKVTPAMKAGLMNRSMEIEDILALRQRYGTDVATTKPKPKAPLFVFIKRK